MSAGMPGYLPLAHTGNVPTLPAMGSASIVDVAARAGVGKSTAARALSGSGAVSEQTRERVQAAARALRYRPHRGAADMRRAQHSVIGVVIPHSQSRGALSSAVQGQKLEGMAQAAREADLDLQIFVEDLGDAEALLALLRSRRVGGLLFLAHVPASVLAQLARYRVPWVGVNWHYADRPRDSYCWTDFSHAGWSLVTHLVDRGCRRLLAFDGLSAHYGRYAEGLRAAASEAGVSIEVQPIASLGRESGELAQLERCFAPDVERPDGVVFGSEAGAAAGSAWLRRHSDLRLGQDLALACFDDLDVAPRLDPPMTAYRQPTEALGRAAVVALQKLMTQRRPRPIQEQLRGELHLRASSTAFHAREG